MPMQRRARGCDLQMSSALAQTTRTGPHSWSRLSTIAAAISLLLSSGALAQTVNNVSGAGASNARIQTAYAEWRRLSQSEVNCVDRSLRGQNTNLWSVIQRGISPADSAVARIRAACRAQAQAPSAPKIARSGTQAFAASVESAAAEKAAADKAAADKLTADKVAADKVAADRAAEKAAAAKMAAEKAAADKAAADKAAAAKAAADKTAADKVAADKAAADEAAVSKAAANKAPPDEAATDKAATDSAKADAIEAPTDGESPRKEAEKTTGSDAFAYVATESRISFIYGLICGPILFAFGGVVFLFVSRRWNVAPAQSEAAAPDRANSATQGEFDRLVTAVLAEQKRRDRKHPEPVAPERELRIDEAALH